MDLEGYIGWSGNDFSVRVFGRFSSRRDLKKREKDEIEILTSCFAENCKTIHMDEKISLVCRALHYCFTIICISRMSNGHSLYLETHFLHTAAAAEI